MKFIHAAASTFTVAALLCSIVGCQGRDAISVSPPAPNPLSPDDPVLPSAGLNGPGDRVFTRLTLTAPSGERMRIGQRLEIQVSGGDAPYVVRARSIWDSLTNSDMSKQESATPRGWFQTSNGVIEADEVTLTSAQSIFYINPIYPGEQEISVIDAYQQSAALSIRATWDTSRIPNDPELSSLWGFANLGSNVPDASYGDTLPQGTKGADARIALAWERGAECARRVGVIDAGMQISHPDFQRPDGGSNIWTNPGEIEGDGIDNDDNGLIDDVHGYDFANADPNVWEDSHPEDESFHATHVAGTIGAVGGNGIGVSGVCQRVSIVPIQGLGTNTASLDRLLEAIYYSADLGLDIVNNSWIWGGGNRAHERSLTSALQYTFDESNMLWIEAAGNWGFNLNLDDSPGFPGTLALPHMILVAADKNTGERAEFSNYGSQVVDVSAPGEAILSLSPTVMTDEMLTYHLPTGLASLSGTSMAAPLVAGAAALLWSLEPQLDRIALKKRLLESAEPTSNTISGRLNLARALYWPWLSITRDAQALHKPNPTTQHLDSIRSNALDAADWSLSTRSLVQKTRLGFSPSAALTKEVRPLAQAQLNGYTLTRTADEVLVTLAPGKTCKTDLAPALARKWNASVWIARELWLPRSLQSQRRICSVRINGGLVQTLAVERAFASDSQWSDLIAPGGISRNLVSFRDRDLERPNTPPTLPTPTHQFRRPITR